MAAMRGKEVVRLAGAAVLGSAMVPLVDAAGWTLETALGVLFVALLAYLLFFEFLTGGAGPGRQSKRDVEPRRASDG